MIIQTNTFICESNCGEIVSQTVETDIYEDPIIILPEGWDFIGSDILCPKCLRARAEILERMSDRPVAAG